MHIAMPQFVEVEEDDLEIPLEELFAPMPAGESPADEDGKVRVLHMWWLLCAV